MRNQITLTLFVLLGVGTYCVAANPAASGPASPTPIAPAREPLAIQYPTDVLTYHNNVFRQGVTVQETTLTHANVNFNSFGKVGFFATDGKVDAQALYVNKVFTGGGLPNVLYVVTENDSVYAFDANSGRQFWRISALAQGESPSDDHNCSQISPQIGITNTPVIDKGINAPNGAMFFVAMSKDSSGQYHQRLHAVDLTSGAELFGGPKEITATYPGTGDGSQGGQVIFNPGQYAERAGLLDFGGTIYLTFTSHCDRRPYTGWVMAYDGRYLAAAFSD